MRVRNFHIVGGGCFGCQYGRWLLRAKSKGWLDFENIFLIDKDSNCQAIREGLVGGEVQWVSQDWLQYLSDFLFKERGLPGANEDHWVPSPLSPHLLFLAFMECASRLENSIDFQVEDFREKVPPPVKIPLKVGSLAVSFAEWKCPINCIEPSNCPAIQEKRDWDMLKSLSGYFESSSSVASWHVLQCQHLIHGVGTIPFQKIFSALENFLEDIRSARKKQLILATVSGCHGLIGQASFRQSGTIKGGV